MDRTSAGVGGSAPVDNSSTVINKIANLYAERLMSDVCLVVGNVEYPSHRLILCASSEVFQVMLMNPNWSESQEPRVVLRETPSCEAVFEDFLKYLYTGKIQLDYATVIPLVSLADKYNVRDLLRIGLDYMSRNVSTACKRNQVVSWYQFASAAHHRRLADLCRDFIKWNFSLISQNVDYANLGLDLLLGFLQCHDLVIHDEMALFQCVSKWLCERRDMLVKSGEESVDLHIDHYVHVLLPHVRFPMMTPAQLANLVLNPLSESHTELLVEKIRVAMKYHSGTLTQAELDKRSEQFDSRIFTPRLYTAERFCASLQIEHLHNLQTYHCRSLLFSSHKFTAEHRGDEQCEWVVDVYPKGVWFQKCLTVYKPPGIEVPERVLKTVRVSVSTRDVESASASAGAKGLGGRSAGRNAHDLKRVRIGVLLVGEQDNFEHVRKVVTRNFFFSEMDQIVNFDDVVDFDELNDLKHRSHFLSGPKKDAMKVIVVVTPLSKISSLETT